MEEFEYKGYKIQIYKLIINDIEIKYEYSIFKNGDLICYQTLLHDNKSIINDAKNFIDLLIDLKNTNYNIKIVKE